MAAVKPKMEISWEDSSGEILLQLTSHSRLLLECLGHHARLLGAKGRTQAAISARGSGRNALARILFGYGAFQSAILTVTGLALLGV